MYAPPNIFCAAAVGSLGRGQAHTVHGATSSAKAQTKASRLRGAGVVCDWFDNARPSRTPQGDAGVAG